MELGYSELGSYENPALTRKKKGNVWSIKKILGLKLGWNLVCRIQYKHQHSQYPYGFDRVISCEISEWLNLDVSKIYYFLHICSTIRKRKKMTNWTFYEQKTFEIMNLENLNNLQNLLYVKILKRLYHKNYLT